MYRDDDGILRNILPVTLWMKDNQVDAVKLEFRLLIFGQKQQKNTILVVSD